MIVYQQQRDDVPLKPARGHIKQVEAPSAVHVELGIVADLLAELDGVLLILLDPLRDAVTVKADKQTPYVDQQLDMKEIKNNR